MIDTEDIVYQSAPLDDYSLKERLAIRFIANVGYLLIRMIGATLRYDVEGWDNYESVIRSGKLPVWPFWHDRIFASALYFKNRGIVVITSKSRDGDYIARFIQRFGFGAIRGSSSKGGARALIEMRRAMERGIEIAFTVDGPRGPRYEAKPGPVYLAKITGNPILPFLMEPKSRWTLRSWDKLQIPKPFTKVLLTIAKPLPVDPDSDAAEIESRRQEMQISLDDLVERGARWRRGA